MTWKLSAVVLILAAATSPSFAEQAPEPPVAQSPVQTEQDQARWSDLEAQRRATQGDYDGAVQAERQADKDLREADRLKKSEDTGR